MSAFLQSLLAHIVLHLKDEDVDLFISSTKRTYGVHSSHSNI